MDSRGVGGKSMYVSLMNRETHRRENLDYKKYAKASKSVGLQTEAANNRLDKAL